MNQLALNHLNQDEKLRQVIASTEITIREAHNDVYYELFDSIISQQLSVKAATTICNRFLDTFPNRYPTPDLVLERDIESLRAVGLSGQKAGYLRNVAQFALDTDMRQRDWSIMSDEEIISYLTTIKGVGKWTVQMILMFTLQRQDVFPIDDLGIQQGMVKIYGLTETGKVLKQRMEEIATAWQPYRTLACRYVWRWKDSGAS
jgi:DNA-3-methyladenine glycosylase II